MQNNEFEVPVSPVGNGLILRAQAWRTSQDLVGNGFFWVIGSLSLLTAWMLIANWRHTRKRQQTQKELIAETNFRRAMENSILTGMRALDLEGRISYVNLAFCQMTGWQEQELIGAVAPYPYWPEEDKESLMTRLEEELSGKQTLRLSPDRCQWQTNRLDDLDDRHHRAQSRQGAIGSLLRTLHHRARSFGRICFSRAPGQR
jgi:PAS domain-containing protein